MSNYYLYARNTGEFFELPNHSWYRHIDDLYTILLDSQEHKESFITFLDRLKKRELFKGFHREAFKGFGDETEDNFLTPDNIKYFFKPLYDWANLRGSRNLALLDDCILYDYAVRRFCEERNLVYQKETYFHYSLEIERELVDLIKNKDPWDGLINHCFKMVGSIYYSEYKNLLLEVGIPFSYIIAELKNGASIWRKSNSTVKYKMDNNGVLVAISQDDIQFCNVVFCQEDIFAEDWTYEYKDYAKDS